MKAAQKDLTMAEKTETCWVAKKEQWTADHWELRMVVLMVERKAV